MIRRGVEIVTATMFMLQGAWGQVDQENWPGDPKSSASFNSFYGLRQEFRPTLTRLDTVELSISPCAFDPIYRDAATATLAIHQGGVAGPVMAYSSPVVIPPEFRGSIVFRFVEPLSLAPDQRYAIHPFSEGAAGWCFNADAPFGVAPGYPKGRLFFSGGLVEGDADLFFREGIGIPEPAPSKLLGIAAGIAATLLAWNKARPRT